MRSIIIFLPVALLALAGCSSDREFTVTHESLTQAAIEAISEEALVPPDKIQRVDEKGENGCATVLKAPYIDYSKIKVIIDSCNGQNPPNLEVRIVTGSFFYMRHLRYEDRFQELVLEKLLARAHGEESHPSSLPPPPPPDLKHLPPSASAISTMASEAETPVIPPVEPPAASPAAPEQPAPK